MSRSTERRDWLRRQRRLPLLLQALRDQESKLEGLIEKLFTEGMDTEQRVAAEWLEGVRR